MKTVETYETRMDPVPGPPVDPEGKFLPLPQRLPGQPQPTNWPPYIVPPREVAEVGCDNRDADGRGDRQ